jgi:hypothetical protein
MAAELQSFIEPELPTVRPRLSSPASGSGPNRWAHGGNGALEGMEGRSGNVCVYI